MTDRRTGEEGRRRLDKAGFVLEEGPEGEPLWREPGTGRLLPGGRASYAVRGVIPSYSSLATTSATCSPRSHHGIGNNDGRGGGWLANV
jgi:hypothetical protein